MFYIMEEATEAIVENVGNDLQEAIDDANQFQGDSRAFGRFFVIDDDWNIMYDTNPGVSFKF